MTTNNLDTLIDREITVLMGGWSAEREISLKTGKAVTDSIKSLGLKVRDIDLISPEEIEKMINSLDLVFIALHGRGGEDGYIQKILEENKIQFTGSSSGACEVAMNKAETKKIWRDLSLPTPDFVEIRNAGTPNLETTPFLSGENDVSPLEASFVVKPAREGSSFGISIVHPEEKTSLEDAMKKAIEYDDILIVEAFVEGDEITVPILGEEILTPITIKPKNLFYDFEAKYLREDTEYLKSDLNPEEFGAVKEFSLNAFSCLGCEGWGRVDLIKDRNNNFQIIEVNTVPGLTETSLVPKSASFQGIDFDSLITRILNTACVK
ncbi:MAG: D-alanine--D-alanine ligase [Gammaproteobacteria bacterium]|nr:MAG: D-alanine--D-alanine ligase [Gammaproteobacteria bacterium]